MNLHGKAYPKRNTDSQEAVMLLDSHGRLTLQVADESITASLDEVKITSSVGTTSTKILFPDGWLFEAKEQPCLREFLVQTGQLTWISRLEDNIATVLVSIFLVAVLTVGGLYYGTPWLAEKVTGLLPDSVADYVGEEVLSTLDEELFEPSLLSSTQQSAIRERFNINLALVRESGETFPHSPKIVFRRWGGGINAFALSDGTIIVTDSIIKAMGTDAQLDSILFHELGHVKYQHVMKSIVRSSILSVSFALLTGESSGIADNLAGLGVFMFSNGYSREDETEADLYGAKLMKQVYGTTLPMKEMFELLKESGAGSEALWLSSHPDIDSRIKSVE